MAVELAAGAVVGGVSLDQRAKEVRGTKPVIVEAELEAEAPV